MANEKLTGALSEELAELQEEHEGSDRNKSFEEQYCLVRIPHQPDDYEGPQRYCTRFQLNDESVCYYHRYMRHLDPLANMKHGLRALRKNLIADFSDDEREAYEDIVEVWSDYYNIEDPAAMDTLESMAVEIVREVRADAVAQEHREAGNYIDDGMTRLKEEFGPEGESAYDHVSDHIIDIRQRTRRLIEKLKDNLGITRKHQDTMDAETSKTETLDAISESMSDSLAGGEYNPDEFEEPEPGG